MADYHPLIARAVAGLEKNTGEARRALYERARTALVAQLRGVVPPLEESEITRERLALEESIRKVEAEAARQSRFENRPATVRSRVGAAPAGETVEPETAASPPAEQPERPQPEPPRQESRPQPPADREPPFSAPVDLDAAPGAERKEPRIETPRPRPRPPERSTSLADEAMRGFREGWETSAQSRRSASPPSAPPGAPSVSSRAAPPVAPPASHEFDRLDTRDAAPDPDTLDPALRRNGSEGSAGLADTRPAPPRSRPAPREEAEDAPAERRPSRSFKGLVLPILSLVMFLALCGTAILYRETIMSLYYAFMGAPGTQTARDTPPPASPATPSSRPKISDRIGPGGAQDRGAPAVAQRVVLIEEEPGNPQGRQYVGQAIWRTETVSPGPGQPPEIAVKAEVEIPERKMNMTWSLRRNTDKALPASHTIEIMFTLPPDFAHGGINNIPGILMKQADQPRGTPLAGLAVKVTTNFFLIGLSAVEADAQRNVQLLRERATFDIPIVYNDNRRAILALDKGTPGERAFEEAFAAWR